MADSDSEDETSLADEKDHIMEQPKNAGDEYKPSSSSSSSSAQRAP